MSSSLKVAVLGAGNMGTAIAHVIGKNGHQVRLWNHEGDPEPLLQIAKTKQNKKYLPGLILSANISPQPNLELALKEARVVFFVVPSLFMESLICRAADYLHKDVVCVDASKGMDEKSLGLIPDMLDKNISCALRARMATISGPAIAGDMARDKFTAMNVSSKDKEAIRLVKKVMENKMLKLRATDDMIGVEVTGSFKNVYAIAMGMCDGAGLPMNTKAALLVVALREIGELVNKMGGRAETVYDLAGLGDLVGTGLCLSSRNRRFGEYLVKGLNNEQAKKKVGQAVEGIDAGKTLHLLGKKHKVRVPFAEMIYNVVWKKKNAKASLEAFLQSYV